MPEGLALETTGGDVADELAPLQAPRARVAGIKIANIRMGSAPIF